MRTSSLILFSILALNTTAAELSEATLKGVSNFYNQVVSSLAPSNVPFADIYKQPLTLERWKYEERSFYYHPSVVFVYAQFNFQVTKEPKPQLILLNNHRLGGYITSNELHRIPAWTPQEAIDKAKQILNVINITAVTNMAIKEVTFDRKGYAIWRVCWEPHVQNIKYDSFIDQSTQKIEVDISEKYGFVGYYGRYDFPVPKRMDVLVTQEAAIAKALKTVPLIQRSPYYLQCRLPGFVASGVRKAELLIAAPNWLLDPKRAIWLRDKLPDETRLCWVVTFTSVYSKKTDPDEMLILPLFLVYIDAATGEVVGANFT